MDWNEQQKEVIKAAVDRLNHIQVQARAGSGKSTVIRGAAKAAEGRGRIIAFNKTIATDMTGKLQKEGIRHVTASTTHAMAYGAIMRGIGTVEMDGNRGRAIAKELIGDEKKNAALRSLVTRLASLCKTTLTDPTPRGLEDLIEHYDLDDTDVNGDLEKVYELVPKALDIALSNTSVIDFDDQLWLTYKMNLPVPRYDFLFIDESQDVNALQREVALMTQADQIICVGDDRQAIYGFAGADVDAMRSFREKLQAQVLPLSICYRCPVSHLELAREIVPDIRPRPDAPDGKILELDYQEAFRKLRDGDLVISRINAPLAQLAMKLVSQGKKATIRGRNIGDSLLSICDRWMVGQTLIEGITRVTNWKDREIKKLEKAGKDKQIESLTDRVNTVFALSDGCHSVADLRRRIQGIFQENPTEGIILSSVHRAKGLEAQRVMILSPSLMPWPKAEPGTWQYQQELNLRYVALTRAKQELWMVEE